jgi:hypothetical protein
MKIYVAGGGGPSVANAAETVGRTIAAKAGLVPTVEDVLPASAGDPSGTVSYFGGHGAQMPLVTLAIWGAAAVCSQSSSALPD